MKKEHEIAKLKVEKTTLETQIASKDKVIKAAEEKLGEVLPTGTDATIVAATKVEDTVLEGMKQKTNPE